MTVKVSKSAINLRSKLNEIEKVSLENFRAMSGTFSDDVEIYGDLLVGTTSASIYNDTSGDGVNIKGQQGQIIIAKNATSASDPALWLNNTGVDGSIVIFAKDGASVGSIGTSGGFLYVQDAAGIIKLGITSGTHLETIDSVGSVQPRLRPSVDTGYDIGENNLRFKDLYLSGGVKNTSSIYMGRTDLNTSVWIGNSTVNPGDSSGAVRDDAVSLGYASGRFKDLYLSGGVYLGGTGAANKLDDYEEGTWTITVKDGTGNTYSSTYQNRAGRYTKVGRIVTVTFELYVGVVDLTSNGLTGNQAIVIAGLPFNSNSDQFTAGAVSNSNGINYTGDSLGLRIGRDTDEIEIITFSAGTGANDSPVTVTQFNNGNRLVYGTAVYTTA